MPVVEHLCCFALKQFGGDGFEMIGKVITDRYSDHGKHLLTALDRANRRAWKALEIALTGESFWRRLVEKVDDRGFRQQMRVFLDQMPLPELTDKHPYYQQCIKDLKAALAKGVLLGDVVPAALLARAGPLAGHGDPQQLLRLEKKALRELATAVQAEGYQALGWLLAQPASAGESIVVVGVRFFFRREVEGNPQLATGLQMSAVENLSASQNEAFHNLGSSLDRFERHVEAILSEAQAQILSAVADLHAAVDSHHQQTVQRFDALESDIGAMRGRMDVLLERLDLLHKPMQARHSLSIQNERERQLVKDILQQYRQIPDDTRRRQPEVVSKMGKLLMAAGEFQSAEHLFHQSVKYAADDLARAEAHYNTYRAALEQRQYDTALRELMQACAISPARYALFPQDRYEAERILGAGGFGVTLLCRHRISGGRVAIKSLTMEELASDGATLLSEAGSLEQLRHPAIIGVRDCGYADREQQRPYIIMEYFEGKTLEELVQTSGPLPLDETLAVARLLAEGMEAAHAKGLLHRDIKPANILLRKTDGRWDVRIIDFGLALKDDLLVRSGSTARRGKTIIGNSISGTIDYAAPEQLGKLPGTRVGARADVYGYGRTLNYASFGLPEVTLHQYRKLPPAVADFLSHLVQPRPEDRPENFTEVLRLMRQLGKASARREADRPILDAVPELVEVEAIPRRREPAKERERPRDSERDRQQERPPVRDRERSREESRRTQTDSSTRIIHAALAWFLGAFGAHKFAQGNTQSGIIRLLVSLTCFGMMLTCPLAIVEMVIYLTKSNEEYARIYLEEKKDWL